MASTGIELYRNTARYITICGCEIGSCRALPQTDFFDDLYKKYVNDPPKANGDARAKGDANADPFDFSDAAEQVQISTTSLSTARRKVLAAKPFNV